MTAIMAGDRLLSSSRKFLVRYINGCLSFRKSYCCETAPKIRPSQLHKLIKVAIIGTPNSGKSTLINKIVERSTCPVSRKVHTTMSTARAIYTNDQTQIIFLDTPGIVSTRESKKYKIQDIMKEARLSLKEAHIIGVMQDMSIYQQKTNIHPIILEMLRANDDIPSFLILNKIDILKTKLELLYTVRTLCCNKMAGMPISIEHLNSPVNTKGGYPNFSDAFMISALENDGTEDIREYLLKNAKKGGWIYRRTQWTDKKPEEMVKEVIRARLLDFLPQEIPYLLKVTIQDLRIVDNHYVCSAVVICNTERKRKLIVGSSSGRWKMITDSTRAVLTDAFQMPVYLNLDIVTKNSDVDI